MNKIININLAGQAIAIDEKAYDTLKSYLATLEKHFRNTSSGSEILEDIEARIAEMFQIKIRNGHTFIDQAAVDEAIEVMGSPNDMGYAEEAEEVYEEEQYDGRKKLFRDSEDKILGGVCSGLAAYLDVDTSVVRLLTIVLVIFAGIGIIPYLILWIILPQTRTPQDRFRMHGETPDIDRIAKRVRQEAENVASNIKKNESLRSVGQSIVDLFARVIRWFSKFFGGAVLMALVIAGVAITTAFIFGMSETANIRIDGNILTLPHVFESALLSKFFMLSLLLIIVIPIGALAYLLISFIFNLPMQRFNLKTIFATWLLCLAIFVGISIYGSSQLKYDDWQDFKYELEDVNTI
ncbi:MAG: PspC domain-containing protein [Bacteroidia bacterium]